MTTARLPGGLRPGTTRPAPDRPSARSRLLARAGAALAATTLAGLILVPSAEAHVTVDPAQARGGELVQLTFTVPNEQRDEATIGLDVTLPEGFVLESAQSLPGWTTTVRRAPDQTATAIRWTGGRSEPGTFVTFAVRGRMPTTGDSVVFPAVQRYERTTAEWTDPDPGAESAAPAVRVGTVVTAPEGTGGAGPDGGQPGGGSGSQAGTRADADARAGTDDLARSRSALALALAGAALLLAGGAVGALVVTRRGTG